MSIPLSKPFTSFIDFETLYLDARKRDANNETTQMITPEQLAKLNTEHAHQAALFCWASNYVTGGPPTPLNAALRLLFAIPNGDQRGDGTSRGALIAGARLKAEGQRNGVPDIFLAWPKPHSVFLTSKHGLFIEMKKPGLQTHRNGGCSDEQVMWHGNLNANGYCVAVCYSWIEARDAILKYIEG